MNYLRYGTLFLAVALGTALLVTVLGVQVETPLGLYARILVPAMIAALIEGQQFARRTQTKPDTARAWRFALIATFIAVSLNLGLGQMVSSLAPEFATLFAAPALSSDFNALLMIYTVGYLISNRFFLGLGASNEMGAIARRKENEDLK